MGRGGNRYFWLERILILDFLLLIIQQAVNTGTPPSTEIPSDNKYKTYGKKLPKPTKAEVVAAREARSCCVATRVEDTKFPLVLTLLNS